MKIIEMHPEELIPYENNPRKNEAAVDAVASSIKEFGFQQPIIVDKDNVIICGHTRAKAAQRLGMEYVPVIRAENLTDEQVKAYRLADNKTGELAQWDFEKLASELDEISDIDMALFGFVFPEDETEGDDDDGSDDTYSGKTNIPQYDITGEVPTVSELVERSKTDELIEEIESSDVTQEEKKFLKAAAQRHMVFNYKKIAEYYAAASEDMQKLMEKSALVIIDYNDAIMYGYTKLSERIQKMIEENK